MTRFAARTAAHAGALLAMALTSAGMIAVDAVHPPACATTLIVSLGLLPTVREGLIIAVAVTVLVGSHAVAVRLLGADGVQSVPETA